MKIKWLGHTSFIIISDTGTKIITDPYFTGGNLSYGEIRESVDIVTVSHDHSDHNNVAAVRGNPKVIIPMHFKNNRCAYPIAGVDEFIRGKREVERLNTSEAEFKPRELQTSIQIIVLKPAL